MKQNRFLFICEHERWIVKRDGEYVILEYEGCAINSWYDRDKDDESVVYSIRTKEADLIKKVTEAYKQFDASFFAESRIIDWHERKKSAAPVMTYADAAKSIYTALEKLSKILSDNQSLDPFEEKVIACAKKNGFDALIRRGTTNDLFWFQKYGEERLTGTVWKTYSDEEEICFAEDKERLNELLLGLREDIHSENGKTKSRGLSLEERKRAAMIAEDGKSLIQDLETAFGV